MNEKRYVQLSKSGAILWFLEKDRTKRNERTTFSGLKIRDTSKQTENKLTDISVSNSCFDNLVFFVTWMLLFLRIFTHLSSISSLIRTCFNVNGILEVYVNCWKPEICMRPSSTRASSRLRPKMETSKHSTSLAALLESLASPVPPAYGCHWVVKGKPDVGVFKFDSTIQMQFHFLSNFTIRDNYKCDT